MFDTGWVLPQQLTPLLMRRALSSRQMAPAGTLPHTHTHKHVCVCVCAHILHATVIWSSRLSRPTVAGCQRSLPILPWGSPFLSTSPPTLPRFLPPSLPPLPPSISGSCLSMSQHCRCHNSPAGRTAGEEKTGEGLRGERGGVSLLPPPPPLCTWDGERCFPPTQATLYEVSRGWTNQFSRCILVTMGFQTFSGQNPPRLVGALVCVLHLALGVNEQGTSPAARPCLQPTRAAYWLLRSGLIGREEPDPGKSIRRKRDISSLVLREERRGGVRRERWRHR